MLKKIFKVFLTILFVVSISIQIVSAQNDEMSAENQFNSSANLRHDLKSSEIVAYVDVKNVKLAGKSNEINCESTTKFGYCSYLLTAEIKEIFKGKLETKKLEFHTVMESGNSKKRLLGGQIVFLVWNKNNERNTKSLITIENSIRDIKALELMRRIVNPQSKINETDENEPYARKSIEKEFESADIVIFGNVTKFNPVKDPSFDESIMDATVKEVFKSNLKAGQKITFEQSVIYRSIGDEDLGEQIIFLSKKILAGEVVYENGKIVYERVNYVVSDIRHDVLDKLRSIAKKK